MAPQSTAGLSAQPKAPSPSSRIAPARPQQTKLPPPVLQLQRTLGNRRLAQLIRAKRITVQGKIIGIQRKPNGGAADDQHEQEADRVARQVMSMSDSQATPQSSISAGENKDKVLQTKPLTHELTHVVQQMDGVPQVEGPHNKYLQYSKTHSAGLQRVHLDAAGRKVFDCPDFIGNRKLEACLNDKDRLRPSDRGPTVATVQKRLLRDGANLGKRGADGDYGPATAQAVITFKKKYDLHFTEFPDIGPGTMRRLDELCLPSPQPSCPPCPEDPRTPGCPACPPATACPPCPESPRTAGCPPCSEPSERPVFLCTKSIAGSFLHQQGHAFFRAGGAGPGNPTFELEHDEKGDHCTCGIQGIPMRDYKEDFDEPNAPCTLASAISESCLVRNWNTYPIGKYCALGPNSNTYARFLAEKCGATGLRPPGGVKGFDDSPPKAGSANNLPDARLLLCDEIDCGNTSCLPPPPLTPREAQVGCVKNAGLCGIPGGKPTDQDIDRWNKECRRRTGYEGEDITTKECP